MELAQRFPSYECFGSKITPTTIEDLIELLQSHIDKREQCVVASQNMHGLRVRTQIAAFEKLHRLPRTYVHIDGMPIVWLCKLAGIRAARKHRVTLVDFIWPMLEHAAARGWRVFYLGATQEVLTSGIAAILERVPNLQILGHSGFFDSSNSAANRHVLDEITAFKPDVVLAGMGMGRQEQWIYDNLPELAPACVITVGACIEYIAGAVAVPPRWMGRAGLEWSFRLIGDPKRFWYRYLVEPWYVLGSILRYISVRAVTDLPLTIDSQIMGPVTAVSAPVVVATVAAVTTGASASEAYAARLSA